MKYLILLCILPMIVWAQPEKTNVITISGSACYGDCPVFDLMLFADGTLIFNGQENVQAKGIRKLFVPKSIFTAAIGLINEYKFYNFKDAYFSKEIGGCADELTDQPSKTIQVQYNNKIKVVVHDLGCKGFYREQNLIDLESKLYELLKVNQLLVHETNN